MLLARGGNGKTFLRSSFCLMEVYGRIRDVDTRPLAVTSRLPSAPFGTRVRAESDEERGVTHRYTGEAECADAERRCADTRIIFKTCTKQS